MAIATQPAQGPAAEQGEGLSAPSHSIVAGHSPIEIPEASLLFDADFVRSGNDLTLVGHDGQELHIVNYFGAGAPDLMAPNHAMLDGQTVTLLAGPQFPGQYAQAGGATQTAEPIGSVETLQGTASAQRADGTTHELKVGDPVFESDVVSTGSGSNIGMKLADGTLVTLQESGKLAINEFVYQASGTDNSALLNVIQGTFSLFAGQVAPTGDMKIKTPIATMGIRGTSIIGVDVNAILGRLSLTQDPGGHVGFIEIFNNQNGNLFTILRTVFEKITISESGLLSLTPKTPEELSIDQTLTELLHNFSSQVPQQGPDESPRPQTGSPFFQTPNIQEINFDNSPPLPDTPELVIPVELLESFLETLLQIPEIRDEIILSLTEAPNAGQIVLDDQPEGGAGGDEGTGEGGGSLDTTLPFDYGSSGPGSVGFAALNGQPVLDAQGNPVTNGGEPLVYVWDPQTNTLTAVVPGAEGEPGEVVFTVVVNPTTGEVSVTINGALDHFGANGEFLSINVPFIVQAANGATATGTLTVGISDDVPQVITAPDVADWQTLGQTDTIDAHDGQDPTQGSLMTLVRAEGSSQSEIEGFLGLQNGVLDTTAEGDATIGSAVKISLEVSAGDVVTFDWNFSAHDYLPYNDFAFVVIDGQVIKLADLTNFPATGFGVPVDDATGWTTFSYTVEQDGVLELGLGVVNVNDDVLHSDLLIDNLQLNGELVDGPGTGDGGAIAVVGEGDIVVPGEGSEGGDGATATGEFAIDFGADGFGSSKFTGAFEGPNGAGEPMQPGGNGVDSGLTSGDEAILFRLSEDGQTIEGYVPGEDGEEIILTASLNEDDAGWTVELFGNVDHGYESGSLSVSFTVEASDADHDTIEVSLDVTIVDGVPVAGGDVAEVTGPQVPANNVIILMDTSSSMTQYSGDQTRMQIAKEAALNLVAAAGIAQILVVDFANGVHDSDWGSAHAAETYINGLQAGGSGTNLDSALHRVSDTYGDAGPAENTYIYVISDGGASTGFFGIGGDYVSFGEEVAWKLWLAANGIDGVFAYDVGGNADWQLEAVGWNPSDPFNQQNPQELSEAQQLADHFNGLTGYEAPTAQGNVLANDDLGADGLGGIHSIVIDGVTYQYAPESGSVITLPGDGPPVGEQFSDGFNVVVFEGGLEQGNSVSVDTQQGGQFTFHFADGDGHSAGDWEYTAPMSGNTLPYEHIQYTVADGDGDTTTSSLVVEIEPDLIDGVAIGGEGADTLTSVADHAEVLVGGMGADTFVLNSFDVSDFIADYNMDEGDVVDLSALLDGLDVNAENFSDFVQISENGDGAVDALKVDSYGTGNFSDAPTVAHLNGDAGVNIIVNDSGDSYNTHNPVPV